MISVGETLERLREGNRRFVSDDRGRDTLTSQTRRNELATDREPFAIILGCSDSRVPAEIVFDQGLGDLFVTGDRTQAQPGGLSCGRRFGRTSALPQTICDTDRTSSSS
jgi:hypothetical protein